MKNFFKILTCFLIYFLCLKNLMVIANENIVADLSENNVEISTTFSGAKILLFGAYDGKKDDDIIVIVSGDGDFIDLVHHLKGRGVHVEAISFLESTNEDLITAVDYHIPIDNQLLIYPRRKR